MVNINQVTLFNKVEYPYVVRVEDLKHMHIYRKSLFRARKISNVLLVGRLKNAIENWKILTNCTEILSSVEGNTIQFHKIHQQKNIPNSITASRDSAMNCLDERFKVQSEHAYIFTFHKLHKSWRKSKAPSNLYLYRYWKDQELCVVSVLDEYLKHTKTWRTNVDKFQLLTYKKLHAEVHSSTVPR